MTLRQAIAKHTPPRLRKAVRMGEHYARRLGEWLAVMREMSGADPASKRTLLRSFAVAPMTSLRKLDGFEPPAILDNVTLGVRGVGNFYVRSQSDDIIHILTAREPHVRLAIETNLSRGDKFIDAGANIGFYSVLAANLVGAEGHVIAVEMMPDTASSLRANVKRNRLTNVTVVERALSEHAGNVIEAHVSRTKFGQASIAHLASESDGARTVLVQTTTLAELLEASQNTRLMKMDLEGAEYLALKGAGEQLRKIETIVFESNDSDRRVFDLLTAHGFRISRLRASDYLATRESA